MRAGRPAKAASGLLLVSLSIGVAIACASKSNNVSINADTPPEASPCETAGEKQCAGSWPRTCTAGSDGGLVWTNGGRCAEPSVCKDGACQTCSSDCTAVGAKTCNGAQIRECKELGDGCIVWQDTVKCPIACESGKCTDICPSDKTCLSLGATRCSGEQPEVCEKSGDCVLWQAKGGACGGSSKCQAGVCVPNCDGKPTCSTSGKKDCLGDQPVTCTDDGGCLVWKDVGAKCGAGLCSMGACGTSCVPECTVGSKDCTGDQPRLCIDAGDGCGKWTNSGAACAPGKCSGGTCMGTDCTPMVSTKCTGTDVYWVDSCGVETLKQSCGSVTYGSNYCSGGNVVRNKSTPTCSSSTCGTSTLVETVSTCSYGCTSGVCDSCSPSCPSCRTTTVSNGCGGTCSANCSGTCSGGSCCTASSYWTPTTGSETDTTGQQVTGCPSCTLSTISVGMRMELREASGGGLEMRACKTSGTFSSPGEIWVTIYDAAKTSAGRTVNITGLTGATCSSWLGLLGVTGYTNGQKFSARWAVISPKDSYLDWTDTCSRTKTAATGTCWNGSTTGTGLVLTRTCKP